MRALVAAFASLLLAHAAVAATKTIHVFVALCDNATQGIIPVPAKIGNGDDLDNNLYWGCDDGLRSFFKASKRWKLLRTQKVDGQIAILERCVFRHREHDAVLVADAYRGAEMKRALEDFFSAASGGLASTVAAEGGRAIAVGGKASFVAFIGHNGLMDFSLPFPPSQRGTASSVPAVVFCCKSHSYFSHLLDRNGAQPVLMTTQLMYPGSFIIHAALEGWLTGRPPSEMRELAAAAYAKNQRISVKAARGVFIVPESPPGNSPSR